jgi:hypothetical protein
MKMNHPFFYSNLYSWVVLAPEATQVKRKGKPSPPKESIGRMICFWQWEFFVNILHKMPNSFSLNLLSMCQRAKYLDTQGTLLDAKPLE